MQLRCGLRPVVHWEAVHIPQLAGLPGCESASLSLAAGMARGVPSGVVLRQGRRFGPL